MQLRPSVNALAATAAAAAAAGLASAQDTTCHDYVIISTRGTYEVQGPSIAFPGMIKATLAAIPNGVEYDTVYPAAANQTAYFGADDIVRYIDAGLKACPQQRYALLGYSQGATATEEALQNYTDPSSAGYQAIRAVLVVGDPAHKPDAPVNVDQNGGSTTSSYAGVLYNADKNPNPFPAVWYANGRLLDICYQEDSICAPKYPNSSFVPGHLHYGDQVVQTQGANFLIAKLGGGATASSSASPAANSTLPGPARNATSSGGIGIGSSGGARPTGVGSGAGSGAGSGSGSGSGTASSGAAKPSTTSFTSGAGQLFATGLLPASLAALAVYIAL